MKARCIGCQGLYQWYGPPKLKDVKCPVCGTALQRTNLPSGEYDYQRLIVSGAPLLPACRECRNCIVAGYGGARHDLKVRCRHKGWGPGLINKFRMMLTVIRVSPAMNRYALECGKFEAAEDEPADLDWWHEVAIAVMSKIRGKPKEVANEG